MGEDVASIDSLADEDVDKDRTVVEMLTKDVKTDELWTSVELLDATDEDPAPSDSLVDEAEDGDRTLVGMLTNDVRHN